MQTVQVACYGRPGKPRTGQQPDTRPARVVKSNGSTILVEFADGSRVWVRRERVTETATA